MTPKATKIPQELTSRGPEAALFVVVAAAADPEVVVAGPAVVPVEPEPAPPAGAELDGPDVAAAEPELLDPDEAPVEALGLYVHETAATPVAAGLKVGFPLEGPVAPLTPV